MMRRALLALFLAASGAVAAVDAHDMWIEPATFSPATGHLVTIGLRVGQDFIGDPLPRDPALIDQFIIDDADGRRPVIGRPGSNPAGVVRVASPGMAIVGYRSNPSRVELSAEKFAQYLREEGLDAVAAVRAARGQTGGVREQFSRCAKSLIRTGEPAAPGGDRALGFTLELVAERNPYDVKAGQELPVRLTYEGRPLKGALVTAINQADPTAKVSARADAAGRVRLRLPRAGTWLVKSVHMIAAPAASGADWESFWASLTFEMPGGSHESATR